MKRADQVGGRLTGKMAEILAETLTKHKAVSLPVEKAAQAKLWGVLAEGVEQASAVELRAALGGLLDDPALPPEARGVLQAALHPEQQDKVLFTIAALVGGFFGMFQAAGQPYARDFLHVANRAKPNEVLSPEQAAAAYVKGYMHGPDAIAEARLTGLDLDRFATLAGVTGNPPGPEELLAAYRRGIVSKATLERGIRQSYIRNEWIGVLEALRYGPVDPSTAVNAAVQSVLGHDQARALAAQGGLDPRHFDIAERVAGSPPGVQEAAELWQRGVINQGTFDQVVRESRVKTKYLPALRAFRRRLLPADTIAVMVATNVKPRAWGMRKLLEHGYSSEDAAAWIERARKQHQEPTRDLTKSQVLNMYGNKLLSRAQADAYLLKLGYDRGERGLLLANVDIEAADALRQALINRVHSLYVAWRIDASEVAGQLDRGRVPAAMRTDLLRLWSLERQANTKDLTKAEIVSAYTHGIFTLAEATRRLAGIGYHAGDAHVILAEHAPTVAQERTLTTAQTTAAYQRKQLTRAQAATRLRELGYDPADVAILLDAITPQAG